MPVPHRSIRWLFSVLIVLFLEAPALSQAQQDPASPPSPRPPAGIVIAKDTTRIEGPLRVDGRIDYLAALHEKMAEGVTAENNAAAVLFSKVALEGRRVPLLPHDYEFYRALEIDAPVAGSEPFVDSRRFIKLSAMGGDDAIREFASRFYAEVAAAGTAPWRKGEHPDVAVWLAMNEASLDDISTGLARPHFFMPLVGGDIGGPTLVTCLLPGVQPMREVGQALAARAMLRLDSGNVEGAISDLLACHHLAQQLGRGSVLIESMVALAIDRRATAGDLALARSGKPSARQLQGYAAELAKLETFDMAGKIDVGERYMILDSIMALAANPDKLREFGSLAGDGDGPLMTALGKLMEASPSIDFNEALRAGNQWHDKAVAAGRTMPLSKRAEAMRQFAKEVQAIAENAADPDALLARIELGDEPERELGRQFGNMIIAQLLPTIDVLLRAEARQRTCMELTRIALLLEAYRIDNDEYPASLDLLAPKYVDRLPRDPYSGADFVYRRDGDAYALYSVGPNGKDDGITSVEAGTEGPDDVYLPSL